MASGTDDSTATGTLSSIADSAFTVRNLVMVIAGVLAGYSISVLGRDAVVLPVVGSLPGAAVGAVGLVAAFAVYRQWNDCGCGGTECGCTGDCGDSCSYDH